VKLSRIQNQSVRGIAVLLSLALAASYAVGASSASASSTRSSTIQMTPVTLARVPGTSIVYLMGYVKCGPKLCARLARTTDNGNTFTAVTPPPAPGGKQVQYVNSYELVFANRRVGFAEVGLLSHSTFYVTFNGAKTWRKATIPFGNRIEGFATTRKNVYAVTATFERKLNEGDGGNKDYRLAQSSLTSLHWSSTPIPNSNFTWGFLGPIAAFGPNVWISEQRHHELLVRSQNFGKTLTTSVLPYPALGSVAGCALTATSLTSLWAQCPTGMQVQFYFSDTGGAKWTLIDPVAQIFGTGGGTFDPVSADLGYLDVGLSNDGIYRITDDGRSAKFVGTFKCIDINPLVFTNAADGLALCGGNYSPPSRLFRTTNGGATWTRLSTF
jgi:hypothetical protein